MVQSHSTDDHVKHRNVLTEIRSWYADKYHVAVVQRNILILLTLISLLSVLFSVYVVWQVTESKTVEPFIIEVEKQTGIITVVNPKKVYEFESFDALRRAYVMQYINAREGYNPATLEYDYYQTVRLLSTPPIWRQFKQLISSDDPNNPIKKYGASNNMVSVNRIVKLRSMTFKSDNAVTVRFTVMKEQSTNPQPENKVVDIEFSFEQLQMTQEERLINPLGFLITRYNVSDETL